MTQKDMIFDVAKRIFVALAEKREAWIANRRMQGISCTSEDIRVITQVDARNAIIEAEIFVNEFLNKE